MSWVHLVGGILWWSLPSPFATQPAHLEGGVRTTGEIIDLLNWNCLIRGERIAAGEVKMVGRARMENRSLLYLLAC